MRGILIGVGASLGLLLVLAAWMLVLRPRPPDTTDPAIFAGDAGRVDHCTLPVLDGAGPDADAIAKVYTPGCGWDAWPLPVLAECREPLAADARDLRGLWRSTDPARPHVERIEQCGDRVVITTAGIIHDFRTDGTRANGADDIEPPHCLRSSASVAWRDDVLSFRPFALPRVGVTRVRRGETLHWTYPGAPEMTMTRICHLPEAATMGS